MGSVGSAREHGQIKVQHKKLLFQIQFFGESY